MKLAFQKDHLGRQILVQRYFF